MPGDDDVTLSGGGTTTVATDAVLADAQALDRVREGLSAMLLDLRIAMAVGEPLDELERTAVAVLVTRDHVAELVSAVTWSMERYSEADAAAERVAIDTGAVVGFGAGAMLSGWLWGILGPFGAPFAGLALPWVARALTESEEPVGPEKVAMPDEVTRVLCDPNVVAAIRVAVSSTDEAILGFGGIPAVNELALASAGITGVSASATLLAALGANAGLLTETPVTVTRTQTSTTTVTSGFSAHLAKVPLVETSPGGAQIRIDAIYSGTDPVRYEAYLGGTADFRPLPHEDAFDTTSNVTAVAGLPAGALRGAAQALELAGVNPGSEITFTGYSQGGIIVAALATSGDYNVQGVVTIAAPAGHVQLPAGIPAVIVEHTDDFVPALGGVQTNTDALIVQRRAFEPGELPPGVAAPAHRMPYYRETAAIMDRGDSAQLIDARHRLDAFSAGADRIVSTYYYVARTP